MEQGALNLKQILFFGLGKDIPSAILQMSCRNKSKHIDANLENRSMSDGGPNNDFWNFSLERESVS